MSQQHHDATPTVFSISQPSPDLNITAPIKMGKKYVSYVSVNKEPSIFFRTSPIAKPIIISEKQTIEVKDVTKELKQYIENLETKIEQYISTNSKEFFGGRVFTFSEIHQRHQSVLKDNDLALSLYKNLKIKDQFGSNYTLDEIKNVSITHCIAIVSIKNVAYTATTIEIPFTVEQLQIFIESRLSEWEIEGIDEKLDFGNDLMPAESNVEQQQDEEVAIDKKEEETTTRYCSCICPLHPPPTTKPTILNGGDLVDSVQNLTLSDLQLTPISENMNKKTNEIPSEDASPKLDIESLSVQPNFRK